MTAGRKGTVEIFFCSHCRQSIPLKDIRSGAAVLRRGRYLCVTCKEIAPEVKAPRLPWVAAVLAVLLVGALGLLGVALFGRTWFAPGPGTSAPPKAAAPPAAAVRAPGTAALTPAHLDRALADLRAGLAADRRRHEGRLRALEQRVAAIPAPAPPDLEPLRAELKGVSVRLAHLAETVAALRRRVAELARTAAALTPRKEAPPKAAPPAAPASPAARWVEQLRDPDPRRRFQAVAELTRLRGPEADRALVRALGDGDFFIRRFAAEEVGARRLREALPTLVELLADPEPTVRAAAATALRRITGRNFGYRSDASERERARGIARWRRYLAGHGAAKKKG